MSLTLKDLRVKDDWMNAEDGPPYTRPASLADLVEVLKQEGAVEVDSFEDAMTRRGVAFMPGIGRFLVLPLGDTP